jgi:quercetin dioxygenase-like cupin family protein
MPIPINRFDARRWDSGKMQKLKLYERPHFFLDVYCLLAGQSQKPHRHDESDKVYLVLEGEVMVRVADETARLGPGEAALCPAGVDHGLENQASAPAAVLVFMAPPPAGALRQVPGTSQAGAG